MITPRRFGDARPTVLIAAGALADDASQFDPFSSNPATDANGNPWLARRATEPACRSIAAFVPAGPYSCDTLTGGFGDPGYIAYSNFADTKEPTQQAPYKPYFALHDQDFSGWGVHGNMTYDLSDDLQFVSIGSWREYESTGARIRMPRPVPVAQLDNQLNHRAWSAEVRLNFEVADGLRRRNGRWFLSRSGW